MAYQADLPTGNATLQRVATIVSHHLDQLTNEEALVGGSGRHTQHVSFVDINGGNVRGRSAQERLHGTPAVVRHSCCVSTGA